MSHVCLHAVSVMKGMIVASGSACNFLDFSGGQPSRHFFFTKEKAEAEMDIFLIYRDICSQITN